MIPAWCLASPWQLKSCTCSWRLAAARMESATRSSMSLVWYSLDFSWKRRSMTFREKGIGLKLWWGPRVVASAKLLSICSFDFFWRNILNIPYIIYPYYVVLCELQDAISMVRVWLLTNWDDPLSGKQMASESLSRQMVMRWVGIFRSMNRSKQTSGADGHCRGRLMRIALIWIILITRSRLYIHPFPAQRKVCCNLDSWYSPSTSFSILGDTSKFPMKLWWWAS